MELEGKYKDWYDRLVKINYGKERAKELVEKFVEWDKEEFWKEKYRKLNKAFKGDQKKVEKFLELDKKRYNGEQRVNLIEWNRKRDLEFLKKAIPKEKLEDGAWYDCDEDAKEVARFCGIAQWNKKRQEFRAPGQQQFGMDGYLDHWEDAIGAGFAGFVPMWKVKEKE